MTKNNNHEKKLLRWKDFPATPDPHEESDVPRIAAYLRRILERYEDTEFIKYLVAPSPTALSGFFQCSEDEILHALQELRRQGYDYETSGHLGPITLWDPLIRQNPGVLDKPPAPWQIFCQALLNPAQRPIAS